MALKQQQIPRNSFEEIQSIDVNCTIEPSDSYYLEECNDEKCSGLTVIVK